MESETVKHIVIRTCKGCPSCKWDRGYDALFCEERGLPRAIRLCKAIDWVKWTGIHEDCPLMDYVIPEIEVKVKEYANTSP